MTGPASEMRGYGLAFSNADSPRVQIDVVAPDSAVADWLLAATTEQARDIAGRLGHPQTKVTHGIYRQDAALRDRLGRAGFEPVTVFNRMRIDFDGDVPHPEPPPGVSLRNDASGLQLRRTAHHVMTESFREHFGFAEWTAEHWIESWESRSTFDWGQLWVAELDGAPVGLLMTTDEYVEGEQCGYVAELGVVHQARGKGIARYMLRYAFARDAAMGRVGTILHVDANNVTPALGLYEGVGMCSVVTVDVLQKPVDVAAQPAPLRA